MKSIVVYDSYFGNTERIAKTIGSEIGARVLNVEKIAKSDLSDAGLIVIGSPTRAFRPTERIAKLLKELKPSALEGKKFAVFDTRIDTNKINNKFLTLMVKLFGYAADSMAKTLRKKGIISAQGTGFNVKDTEGPLEEGEEDRARAWIKKIAVG